MNIFLGELIGTLLLILLGNGANANVLLTRCKGNGGGWIVFSAGWGFAVGIAVYTVGWISGAHINPAVTLGFVIAGKTALSLVPLYLAGQFLGAMIGAFLVWLLYLPHWSVTEDQSLKLLCFCTKPAIAKAGCNLMAEIIATAVLLMGILGIFNVHNGLGSGFGPYAVGILIFSIGLSLGGPTGYAINPARDLGPRLIHSLLPISGKGNSNWSYAWIPVLGPLIGAVIGTLIYQVVLSRLVPLVG